MNMQPEASDHYTPLTLIRFGIRLQRMTEDEKELVRIGRNKEFVRQNHLFQKIISAEEQDRWFAEMNQRHHYVLVIHYRGNKVGVVILRDIPDNLEGSTCGIFIWDEEYIASKVPILSVLTALDFIFFTGGVKKTESIVLKHNTAAIKMNEFLGFSFSERDADSFLISLDRETFLARRDQLINFAKRIAKNSSEHELQIVGTRSHLNLQQLNALLP